MVNQDEKKIRAHLAEVRRANDLAALRALQRADQCLRRSQNAERQLSRMALANLHQEPS